MSRNKAAQPVGPVPVSRPSTVGANAVAGPSRTLLQSSLDIVWSYSRSHAFVGSNLPSSPSFVTRYRRPSWAEDRASFSSRRPSQGQYSVETGEEAVEDDEDEDESSRSRRRSHYESEASLSFGTDAVKPSLQKQPSRVRFVSPSPSQRAPVTERTRLITPAEELSDSEAKDRLQQTLLSASPPEGVPFARRGPRMPERMSESPVSFIEEDEEEGLLAGQSTFWQTLFNTVNALVGIGLLAEPLAFAQAGWIMGPLVLLFCCVVTNYTSKVLARILAKDATLMTYSDIGAKAFGPAARVFISLLFCLELTAVSVALVILFSDSMAELFHWSTTAFKLICFVVVLPTVFMPLRYMSYASLIGILSSFTLLLVVIIDGAIKPEAPGSLRDPAPTSLSPSRAFPLCFGLFASGFGGHALMPSIARDMQEPQHFGKMINLAYIITSIVYLLAGVLGYVMFGHAVTDEITRDLFNTPGFPRSLALTALAMVAVNPLAKFALSSVPIHDTIEYFLGIDPYMAIILQPSDGPMGSPGSGSVKKESYATLHSSSSDGSETVYAGSSGLSVLSTTPVRATISHISVKVLSSALLVGIAILLPGFDRVMSFLGAFAVFMISVIGPLAAHLKLNGSRLSMGEKLADVVILLVAVCMSVTGTVWAFLPMSSQGTVSLAS